ncbi:MAG: hypothetical protein ACRD7E_20675, partial [Bryobacteraceae bacterium]
CGRKVESYSMTLRTQKTEYSESEAAQLLGVTVDRLRSLVYSHIMTDQAEIDSEPVVAFQPSDLMVLRILASNSPAVC